MAGSCLVGGGSVNPTFESSVEKGLPTASALEIVKWKPWRAEYCEVMETHQESYMQYIRDLRKLFERPHNISDYLFASQRVCKKFHTGDVMRDQVLETRTPYHEKNLMDFLIALPVELRVGKCLYKYTMKKYFHELFSLPNASAAQQVSWAEAVHENKNIQSFFVGRLNESQFIRRYIGGDKLRKIEKAFQLEVSFKHGKSFNKWQRMWSLGIRMVILDSWFSQLNGIRLWE